jgi:hypothetical protein
MQRPNAELSTHFDRHWWHDVKHHQKAIILKCLCLYFQTAAHDLPALFFLYEPKAIVRIAVARSSLSPRARTFKVLPTMSLVLPHLNTVPYPIKPRTGHPPTAGEIGSPENQRRIARGRDGGSPIARDRTLDRFQRCLLQRLYW